MSVLAARKAFAAYEPPGTYDEKGFIRPEVRLPEMLAASGAHVERFRQLGGRYPNPQRFALTDGQIRYVTDDLELLVMKKLLHDIGGGISEQEFQTLLAGAHAHWPPMEPIGWL